MASGVTVSDECVSVYNEIKLQHNYRYIIFKVSDDQKFIVVNTKAPTTATYDDFLAELNDNECRYAVFDLTYETAEGTKQDRLAFITWCPDTASIKQKMLYASSKDAIKKKLVGAAIEVQATDSSEIAYETVLERAKRNKHI